MARAGRASTTRRPDVLRLTKTAERLHLSLALQARRDANLWQSAARDWMFNADQVETCREYAADYRRIARDHIADARLAKAARLTSRYHGQIAA